MIYLVKSAEGKLMVLKLARLGRASFKSVLKNRDYIKN
jgi:RIO-like serine/threonine protein kinase